MREAIFLDRDGTLIEDRGWLKLPAQAQFLPGVIDVLQRLQRRFRLFLISNQYGVARGLSTQRSADRITGHLMYELHRDGVLIEDICVCPGARQNCCKCNHPRADFLLQTIQRYDLDPANCWTVGDHPHDAELGRQFGGRGILVLTGHGQQHRTQAPADVAVAADLMEAARIIFSGMRSS